VGIVKIIYNIKLTKTTCEQQKCSKIKSNVATVQGKHEL